MPLRAFAFTLLTVTAPLRPIYALGQSVPSAPHGAELPHAETSDQLIVTIRANGVQRGEFTTVRDARGDFWLLTQDLPRLKLQPGSATPRQRGGETYYSLTELGGAKLSFDEAMLEVSVDFPSQRLEGTHIDLSTRPQRAEVTPAGQSLILSYRLSGRSASGAGPQLTLENDLSVRFGGVLLRQETRLDTQAERRFTRGPTQLVWDSQDRATRLVMGDVVSSAGPYGTVITGGGVLVRKFYDLVPDVVTQPTASVRMTSALPAEVEVSVDGTRISRTNVGPGPITVDNLLLYGGTRTVRVSVTDISGRREVIEQPFLFTGSVLAKGLHDYSYFFGKRSELGFDNAIRYREPALQGYHRYGVTDAVTVSGGGEGSSAFTNAGAGITLRSDRAGLLSVDWLASVDHEAERRARGWAARYVYLTPDWSMLLGRRMFGDGFRSFVASSSSSFPRSETSIGVATHIGAAGISADYVRSAHALEKRSTLSARFSAALQARTTLSAEYQRVRINDRPGWAFNVFLRVALESDRWVASTGSMSSESRQVDVEAGKQLPQGQGFGYRVGSTVVSQAGKETANAYFSGAWNTRPATIELLGSSSLRGPHSQFGQVTVAGALLGVDGEWGLARRVTNSFALARLGIPQPGVDIFLNNQLQGTTDEAGRLFIPDLVPFARQEISVDERQVPMEYNLKQRRRTVTPSFRSGAVVDFGGSRLRALAGRAWTIQNGARVPLASRSWTMHAGGDTLNVETSTSGDFYVENAAAGTYAGRLVLNERTTECRLTVPDFKEAVHESMEGIICE